MWPEIKNKVICYHKPHCNGTRCIDVETCNEYRAVEREMIRNMKMADYLDRRDKCINCEVNVSFFTRELVQYKCLTCPDMPDDIKAVRDEMLHFRAHPVGGNKCPACLTFVPNYLNQEMIKCVKCDNIFPVQALKNGTTQRKKTAREIADKALEMEGAWGKSTYNPKKPVILFRRH